MRASEPVEGKFSSTGQNSKIGTRTRVKAIRDETIRVLGICRIFVRRHRKQGQSSIALLLVGERICDQTCRSACKACHAN